MRVIFVSGPYRSDDAVVKRQRVAQALAMGIELWSQGYAAIVPHVNSGSAMEGLVPEARFLDGYVAMVRRCDAVLALPGWEQSKGARAEVAEAVIHGIPVVSSVDALGRVLGTDPGAGLVAGRPGLLSVEVVDATDGRATSDTASL